MRTLKLGKGKKDKEMFDLLKDEGYRRVFDACQSPKTPNEIAKVLDISGNECAEKLENLEKSGAIVYANGKWALSDVGLNLRNKYWPTE